MISSIRAWTITGAQFVYLYFNSERSGRFVTTKSARLSEAIQPIVRRAASGLAAEATFVETKLLARHYQSMPDDHLSQHDLERYHLGMVVGNQNSRRWKSIFSPATIAPGGPKRSRATLMPCARRLARWKKLPGRRTRRLQFRENGARKLGLLLGRAILMVLWQNNPRDGMYAAVDMMRTSQAARVLPPFSRRLVGATWRRYEARCRSVRQN